ncbi:MAG: ABC transporter substrate-binding protein [Dermatophilaceae bacterium]
MARRSTAALVTGLALGSVALAACGSSSLSGTASSAASSASKAVISVDPALAATLPAKVKAAGKIVVGTDPTYAPNEFLDADGKTVKGMDVDLFNAVAKKFGVTVDWQPAKFESIITGVQGGKYDIGVSSFTVNEERKKQVNMVSYFNAGTLWATAPGNPKKVDPKAPCGLKVAVQKGTVQETDDMPAKVTACQAQGKPITLQVYEGQDQATAAVATDKADAMLADSPVIAYAVAQSGGKIAAAGEIYDAAPYGYVLPKDQTAFAKAIADALNALNTSGDYKAALKPWGNDGGAITSFAVNP